MHACGMTVGIHSCTWSGVVNTLPTLSAGSCLYRIVNADQHVIYLGASTTTAVCIGCFDSNGIAASRGTVHN